MDGQDPEPLTMVETIGFYRGVIRNQGFLGGALDGFRPSAVVDG